MGNASTLTTRHRARGRIHRVPELFTNAPAAMLALRRRGGGWTSQLLTLAPAADGAIGEAWHEDTIAIPAGTTNEVGFTLSAECSSALTLTWIVDRIGVGN